jgi:hypothetical protein
MRLKSDIEPTPWLGRIVLASIILGGLIAAGSFGYAIYLLYQDAV